MKERNNLLRDFVGWVQQASNRSLVIMAGDIHIGGHSVITLKVTAYGAHQMTWCRIQKLCIP
jgi:hypothetical protein